MIRLRTRLLWLVALVVVPSFVLLAVFVGRERTLRREAAEASALRLVEVGVRTQHEAIEEGLRIVQAFGLIDAVRRGDAAACMQALTELAGLFEEGWSLARTLPTGVQDCATRRVDELPRDVSDSPAFQRLRDARAPLIGRYVRATGGEAQLLMPVNVPLRDPDDTRRGLLSAGLRLRWFEALAASLADTPDARVLIVAGGDSVLQQLPLDAAGPSLTGAAPLARAMRQQGQGLVEDPGADGVRRVWAFDRLPSPPGDSVWLAVGLPATLAYEGVDGAVQASLLGLAAWLALLSLLAWWGADRFVLRDIETVLAATERLGTGDLSARTGLVARSDEIGRLAAGVDDMAARLEERREREAQAQKLESIGQLAGGVAHDFNNLLTAIIGNTELARASLVADHPARAELDDALEAAARSAALTRQLLAFARRSDLAPRVVAVHALLDDLASLLDRLIGEHITLVVEPADRPVLARLDTASVEQAILNLVVNARDAMPDGGTVTVSVRHVVVRPGDPDQAQGVPAGRWACVAVHDTGTGMSDAVRARVFEPFFTTKPVGRGTGLGLAMVYGTVRQHEGHVRVESAPGTGTIVRLFFPPAPDGATPDEGGVVPAPAVRPARRRRVLLVEDEAAVRAVIERVLTQQGHEVIVAPNGVAALAACDDATLGTLDLVLTDVVMPELGGVPLVATLRARRPDLPVLFVSGYQDNDELDVVVRQPGTAFLAKPFTGAELLAAIDTRLEAEPAG